MLIFLIISLIVIIGGLFCKYFLEKYTYNNGVCRSCLGKLKNTMRGDGGEIHQCYNCNKTYLFRLFRTPCNWN
jgi:hypothetical protein